jgi:hypothetical protein
MRDLTARRNPDTPFSPWSAHASPNLGSATCHYPCVRLRPLSAYKTLQPAALVTVQGPANQPLSRAEVTLVSSARFGGETRREMKETLADGTARFDAVSQWQVETTMLHGAEVFFWSWCVRKDDYVTFLTTRRDSSDFESNPVVRLVPGESTSCPISTAAR